MPTPPIRSQQDSRMRRLLAIEAATLAVTFQLLDMFARGWEALSLFHFVFSFFLFFVVFGRSFGRLVLMMTGHLNSFEEQCMFIGVRAVRIGSMIGGISALLFWIFRSIFAA